MDHVIETAPGNDRQLRDWDGEHGTYWAAKADYYNAGVARHQPALLRAIAARPGERILEVGCGSGQVAIDLASRTPGVTAVGVDLSSAQLEVARQRAGSLPVEFIQADAQVHDFGEATFDAVVSRTGTMFFDDPGVAFANLARATRPGGRLVMLVWRDLSENEWLQEFFGAIARVRDLPAPPPNAPGPFALSDPARVGDRLMSNGWQSPTFDPSDEEMWFGADPDDATAFIAGQMAWLLDSMTSDERNQALANLHEVMTRHTRDDGVRLRSGAWLVRADR